MRAIISETDEGYRLSFTFWGGGDLPPHLAGEHSLFSSAVRDAERAGIDTWTRPAPDELSSVLLVGYQA